MTAVTEIDGPPAVSSTVAGPARPDFVYVGMSKAGSTYLYQMCLEHPDLFVPGIKDLFFFDREYHRGLDWYLGFYRKAADGQIKGDISHDYAVSEEACERLAQALPGVKILMFVREPVDWLVSRYRFELGRADVGGMSLVEFSRLPHISAELALAQNLERCHRHFGRGQIEVFFYDQLKNNAFVIRPISTVVVGCAFESYNAKSGAQSVASP